MREGRGGGKQDEGGCGNQRLKKKGRGRKKVLWIKGYRIGYRILEMSKMHKHPKTFKGTAKRDGSWVPTALRSRYARSKGAKD